MANSLGNLAAAIHSKGDLVGAEPIYLGALTLTKRSTPGGSAEIANMLSNVSQRKRNATRPAGCGDRQSRGRLEREAREHKHASGNSAVATAAAVKSSHGLSASSLIDRDHDEGVRAGISDRVDESTGHCRSVALV
jgi:hypothetical protein